jgi:hypothetical protein
MSDVKRLYIAGPMSNLPGYNLPAFARAADQLTAAGFDAVNPGRHGVDPAYTWSDYLRRGLTELLTCDGVALLPGWIESRGALLEHYVAMELGMDIRYVHEWLETP